MTDRQIRLAKVQRVLFITFFMNLTVCIAKIILGITTGILSITADGLHALGDALSNVVGFIGIRFASAFREEGMVLEEDDMPGP